MAAAARRGRARLRRYAKKRDLRKTSEPSPGSSGRQGKSRSLIFVVQKHAARRLHWDFRLEWEGTLRSWAVPKGPSLDPADKRLAVEVEDHPVAYAKFEGDIPKGQYGGGHVEIWDRGTWQPVEDFAKGLRKGHLSFELSGRKLRGRWHLVRTRMQGKQPQWLLIKSGDAEARVGADADVIDAGEADSPERLLRRPAKPRTAGGRQSGAASTPRNRKTTARRGSALPAALPAALKPQLATLVDTVPGDDGWVYELKYDGVRLLSRCDGRDVRCISRNGLDWTRKVPPIVDALAKLRLAGAWVDGELIVTDPNGRSDFSLLQHSLEQGRMEELRLCVFDLLFYDGQDLRELPLSRRRAKLDTAFAKLPADGAIRLADQIQSDSSRLLARVCNQHLEGLVAKKIDSPYRGGRSRDWLKIKCRREQEFVVGGAAFLPRRGTGTFSSLLVGVRSGRHLRYAGRVGGGFSAQDRAEWRALAQQLEQKQSPFDRLPDRRPGEVWRWMKPRLVIQVAFADWTQDGVLRQPSYLGQRQDRNPSTVIREDPADARNLVAGNTRIAGARKRADAGNRPAQAAKSRASGGAMAVAGQRLTNPDRVLFPHDGITKLQLAEYFAAVGEAAKPHYRRRPLSILRNTHGSRPFFQKHFLEQGSRGLRVVQIPNADKDTDFVVCDSPEGLLHLAQLGAVELHSWGAVMPKPTHADRLTFDLDPGADLAYAPLRDAAHAIRKLMQSLGLESWVKTTGGKGLHVVVPLARPRPDWDTAKQFTRSVALFMERLAPAMFTSKTGENRRRQKIFVDYLRNGFGATAVAAYSPRWRPGVGIATPVAWEEIDEDIRGGHFNVHNVPDRVAKQRKDPWQGYWKARQSLTRTAIKEMETR